MSDQITINITPDQNVSINPITLNQGVINHSVTHQSGGSDELSHNLLGGLQGGFGNEYYHISSEQYLNLTTGSVVRPSETGQFYPISNPSGFTTGGDLSSYATIDYLIDVSGELQTQIVSLQTGEFYPNNNPSGFITGVDLSFSGNYYTKNESEFRYINATGAEIIFGDKTFHDKVYINNLYVTGSETLVNVTNSNVQSPYIILNLTGGIADGGVFFVTGSGLTGVNDSGAIIGFDHSDKFKFGIGTRASDLNNLNTIASFEEVTGISGNLQTQIFTLDNQTGTYLLKVESGQFYPNSNPSGFITGIDLSSYATQVYVTGISGDLQSQITNLNNSTGQFYPNSNPSGFITGVDLSSYTTINYVSGASGDLQSQITNLNNSTGFYVLNSETGQFYSNDNPSGYITGIDLSNYTTTDYITGASGSLQNQINDLNNQTGFYVLNSETGNFITTNQTGTFYPRSNPSGFITGIDLSSYVLNTETGNFITIDETGTFYPRSNPSGFITGVDTSSYATIELTTGISGQLQTQITTLDNQTGSYYPRYNPSGYITGVDLSFSGNYYTKDESEFRYVNTTGAETIFGDKTFHDKVYINNLYVTGLETIVNTTNTNVASNYIILNLTGGAIDGGMFFITGSGLTGINDSGAIIGFDHSDKFKFGIGTRANDLSNLNTIASFEEVISISGGLQTQISTLNNQTGNYVLKIETGNFITSNQTGQFYSSTNPSGYTTDNYVTGISGGLQTQITTLNDQTGNYYPRNNPSGYLSSASGVINSNISGLSGATSLANIIQITNSGYNAITTPDINTLYIIVG